MSESSAGTPDAEIEAIAKDATYAVRELKALTERIRSLERGFQTALSETRALSSRLAATQDELRRLTAAYPSKADPLGTVLVGANGALKMHRGENNRRMEEYAGEVRGNLVVEDSLRCSVCGHIEGRFVGKGGRLLCQKCFFKGVRF